MGGWLIIKIYYGLFLIHLIQNKSDFGHTNLVRDHRIMYYITSIKSKIGQNIFKY